MPSDHSGPKGSKQAVLTERSSWSLTASNGTYGCQSTGIAANENFASHCIAECASSSESSCITRTTAPRLPVSSAWPTYSMTYGIEAVYMIAPTKEPRRENGRSEQHLAVTAVFSVVGGLALIALAWFLIRRRYRRRVTEKSQEEELHLPVYSRHDPARSSTSTDCHGEMRQSTSRGLWTEAVSVDGGEQGGSSLDLPPPYDSAEVWEGDGPTASRR